MTVQIENISKRYGDKTVLGDFSLTVKDGELLTLIGPSGCGKSTLLKIIAGIVPQNEGRIVLHGEDISHTPPICVVPSSCFKTFIYFRT